MYTSFVIFKSKNESLMSICKSPDKNYFNLVFNVKMLVMCQGEDVPFREWYAIFPNAVELTDCANWTYEGGLVNLITGSTFLRRNSLKGITLRVTSIKVQSQNIEYFMSQIIAGVLFHNTCSLVSLFGFRIIITMKPLKTVNGVQTILVM